MKNPESTLTGHGLAELHERLTDAALFQGLSDDDRQIVLDRMIHNRFAALDVIIRQETMTRNVWLLIEGECEVIKEPAIGTVGMSVPIARLEPYDVFGEMALISQLPHVASVEATSPVQTLRLRGADFDDLVANQPHLACQLACNLVRILSERLRGVDERLTRSLEGHDDLRTQHAWQELRGRLGKLYAGTPG